MKILYVHQYFKTPEESAATRSYWIAKELIARGHKVVMIASTNKANPQPGVFDRDGIEVHYVENAYDNSMSKMQKVRSFVKFLFSSTREAMRQKDVDMVFATSTPLTVGGVALALKRLKRWPYVFEVRDLWPEFPIQIGAIRNKMLISALRKFERRIYEKSSHVVALSPGMMDGVVAAGTPPQKVTMVPNMSKPEEFFPHEPDKATAEKFGINLADFNIIHFGSMGQANGLPYLVEVAKCCQERGMADVKILFMGAGATLPLLEKMVSDYGLKNVRFLGYHNMKTVMEVVNLCDLSVTSFKNLPILYTNSPNKLFDSLSAGKPIVVNSAGWTKDLVENADCGFYVDPENPADFADKIERYKDDADLLSRWGRNARRLSETTYDRSILARRVAEAIEGAAAHTKNS